METIRHARADTSHTHNVCVCNAFLFWLGWGETAVLRGVLNQGKKSYRIKGEKVAEETSNSLCV